MEDLTDVMKHAMECVRLVRQLAGHLEVDEGTGAVSIRAGHLEGDDGQRFYGRVRAAASGRILKISGDVPARECPAVMATHGTEFCCSLKSGHDGDHEARHALSKTPVARWS